MVRKLQLIVIVCLTIGLASCKKYCYDCAQYCSYCYLKTDTSLVVKVCSGKLKTHAYVDSVRLTFPDSLYTCIRLDDDVTVCDSKSAAPDAAVYYEKQDYFCRPRE